MQNFEEAFNWLLEENNRGAALALFTVFSGVCFAGWALFIRRSDSRIAREHEPPAVIESQKAPTVDLAKAVVELTTSLREKDAELKALRETTANVPLLEAQLTEVQRQLENPEATLAERQNELAQLSTDIAQIGHLPPEKLAQAQTALAAGRTAEAEELLAMVEQEEGEGIERAAQAAYLRGEIAEEDIRWADAAAHYTRAANLAPNFDRLYKARKFIWRAGDAAGAVASGEALIATAIAEFGDGSEEHATTLNEHAVTLYSMGHYEEAEPLYRRAIEIGKATIGEAHPDYATRLNNLAALLEAMGRYEEAEPLYRQAIEIGKATIGEAHPDYATRLNNLAGLLQTMGQYEEAEPLYRQAIEIDKATIGEAHPEYAKSLNNLAGLLEYMGQYEKAETLYRQAMQITKASLGEIHPAYATRLNNLAQLLGTLGRYKEAEPLSRQAIEISKATIGEAHPEYAQRLNNLAVFLEGRGRFDEVPDLYRDAVRISRASLGDEHPDTKSRAWNFARHLRKHDATSTDLADLIAAFGDDIGRQAPP